jgi:hypothetical protein
MIPPGRKWVACRRLADVTDHQATNGEPCTAASQNPVIYCHRVYGAAMPLAALAIGDRGWNNRLMTAAGRAISPQLEKRLVGNRVDKGLKHRTGGDVETVRSRF